MVDLQSCSAKVYNVGLNNKKSAFDPQLKTISYGKKTLTDNWTCLSFLKMLHIYKRLHQFN